MEKELKILELTKHYVERYHIETTHSSNSADNTSDGLGTLRQAITRILKKTIVSGKTLWDIIETEGKSRQISIREFEKYCFVDLANYLQKNYRQDEYDSKKLEEDIKPFKKRDEWVEKINQSYEEGDWDHNEAEDHSIIVTEDQIKEKGYSMMLEAIYNLFFEPFKWEELESDLINSHIDVHYNPDIDLSTIIAWENLKDIYNYIGEKRTNITLE